MVQYQAFWLIFVFATCLGQSRKHYDKFKVYRIQPENLAHLEALQRLESNGAYSFWTPPSYVNQTVDVMVAPHLLPQFVNDLQNFNLTGKVLIEDVQELINFTSSASSSFNWDSYHDLEQINNWLYSLESCFSTIVKVIIGGQSYEGRPILGVHVSFKQGNKAVFLEGGIHANEWIAPATVTFIFNELLTNGDPNVREVAESRDWYVFPSVNPDGYEFTKTDRLWRKTRKPFEDGGIGVDANRNWDYHWMDGGASNSSSDIHHAGTGAFSEIETRSLSEFLNSIASNLDCYFAFHSYSQLILTPFGHQGFEVTQTNDVLNRIANKAAEEAAKRYGTVYKVGNFAEALYIGSGLSIDWVAAIHRHVRLVYLFELRDTGKYGFLLPADQIIPTGQEILDAVVSMIQQLDCTS